MTESDGPIVAAVREARARIAAECGYDRERMVQRLREVENTHADRVCPSPKPQADADTHPQS